MKKLSNILEEISDDVQYNAGDEVWIKTSSMEFHNRAKIIDEIDLSEYADVLDKHWKECNYKGYITLTPVDGEQKILVLYADDIKKKR